MQNSQHKKCVYWETLENNVWYKIYKFIFEIVYDIETAKGIKIVFALSNLDLFTDLIYVGFWHAKHNQVTSKTKLTLFSIFTSFGHLLI